MGINDPKDVAPVVTMEGSVLLCNGEIIVSHLPHGVTSTESETPSGRELFVDYFYVDSVYRTGLMGCIDGRRFNVTLKNLRTNHLGQMLILKPKHPSKAPIPDNGFQIVIPDSFEVSLDASDDGLLWIFSERVNMDLVSLAPVLFVQAVDSLSSSAKTLRTLKFLDQKWGIELLERRLRYKERELVYEPVGCKDVPHHWANDIDDTHMTRSAALGIPLHGNFPDAAYIDPITISEKHLKQKIDGFFEHWPSSSSPPESFVRITQAVQHIEGFLLQTPVNGFPYSNFLEYSESYLEVINEEVNKMSKDDTESLAWHLLWEYPEVINEEVNKMFKDDTGSLIRHLLWEYLQLRFAYMFAKFRHRHQGVLCALPPPLASPPRRSTTDASQSIPGGDHNEVSLSSSLNIRPFIHGIISKSRDLLLLMGKKVHTEIVVGYVSDIVQSFMSENMNQVGQSVFSPMQKVLYGISISCLVSSWMLRPTENENTASSSPSSSSTRSRTLRRNELSCMMRGLWLVVALLRFFSILFAPLPFAYGAIAVFACISLVLAPGLYSLES